LKERGADEHGDTVKGKHRKRNTFGSTEFTHFSSFETQIVFLFYLFIVALSDHQQITVCNQGFQAGGAEKDG